MTWDYNSSHLVLLLLSAERVYHEYIQNKDKNKNKNGIGVNLVFKVLVVGLIFLLPC